MTLVPVTQYGLGTLVGLTGNAVFAPVEEAAVRSGSPGALLHGRIPNIQTSWVKLAEAGTKAVLQGGANDLGGTLMEETISRMAGSENGSLKTIAELEAILADVRKRGDAAVRELEEDAPRFGQRDELVGLERLRVGRVHAQRVHAPAAHQERRVVHPRVVRAQLAQADQP